MYSTWSKILSWVLVLIWIAAIVNPLVTVLAEPMNATHVHTDACYTGHNHAASHCYQIPHVHNRVQCPSTAQQKMCGLPTQAGYAYERDWGSGYVWCGSPICQRNAQNNNGLKVRAIDIPYTCTTCKATQTFRYTACVFKNGTVVTHDDSRSNYTTCRQMRDEIQYQCPIAEGSMVWNCGSTKEDSTPQCQEVVTALIPFMTNDSTVMMGTDVSEIGRVNVMFLDGSSREEQALVSGYVPDQPGIQVVMLSYGSCYDSAKQPGAKSISLTIRVTKQVKGIQAEFTGNAKIEGQTVSREELRVYAVFTDDSQEEITGYELIGTLLSLGENVLQITWGGQETTLLVEALPKSMVGIRACYLGGSREIGTSLLEKDAAVLAQYNNGTEEEIRGFTFNPPQLQQIGDNEVMVEYHGFQSTIRVPGYCSWDREGYERTIQDLNREVSEMTQLLQQIRTLLGEEEPITGVQQLIKEKEELSMVIQQDQARLENAADQYEELRIQYEETATVIEEFRNMNQENQTTLLNYKNQMEQLQAERKQFINVLGNNPMNAIQKMEQEMRILEEQMEGLEADLLYANDQYEELAKENSRLKEENKQYKEENESLQEALSNAGKSGSAGPIAGGCLDLAIAGDKKLADILNLTVQTDESGNKIYYTNGKAKDGWGISEIQYPKTYETDLKELPGYGQGYRFYAKHKEGSITYLCQMDQVSMNKQLPKIHVMNEDIGQTAMEAVTRYRFKSNKVVIPLKATASQPYNMKLEYQIVKAGYDFNPNAKWKIVENRCIVIQKPMMARVYIKATDMYGNQHMIKTKGFIVG